MNVHIRPTLTLGIDDISLWGKELCFSPEHPSVVQESGDGWEDFTSAQKVNANPVNLAMTFIDIFDAPVSAFEKHDHTRETLLPTSVPIILAVCPQSCTAPSVQETTFIVIPRGCAMILHEGTWHSHCFGIDGATAYHRLTDADPQFPSIRATLGAEAVTSDLFTHCTGKGSKRSTHSE
jgi:hypothetical protein